MEEGAKPVYTQTETVALIATHAALAAGVHGATGNLLATEDVDDTPVDGHITNPISSNFAYDHNIGEFYVPAVNGSAHADNGYFSGWRANGLNESASATFRVPADFSSLISAKAILLPLATQAAADWNIATGYAQSGEAKDLNYETDATTTYAATADQLLDISIAGVLTGIAANDIVGFRITQGTALHGFDLQGVVIRYRKT